MSAEQGQLCLHVTVSAKVKVRFWLFALFVNSSAIGVVEFLGILTQPEVGGTQVKVIPVKFVVIVAVQM